MAQFIERNKRKGLLGLLLLLFNRRKGLLPLLLLVFLLGTLFVLPSGFLDSIPGASRLASVAGRLAAKLGLAPSDERSFSGLLSALRSAKEGRNQGWGMFGSRGRSSGESSIGFVSGRASDFASKVDAGKALKGGRSIEGILTPEDGAQLPDGVAVTAEELARGSGLVGEANAGGFPGGGALGGGVLGGGASGGGYAGREAMGEVLKAALDSANVPSAGGGGKVAATSGKLSQGKAAAAKKSIAALTNKAYNARTSRWYSLMQLADGRARSQMARDEICKPPMCPPEYAAINVGAVFDGNHLGVAGFNSSGGGATIPVVPGGEGTTPQIPSDNLLTDYTVEGEQIEQDAETCAAQQAHWAPIIGKWAGKIEISAKRLNDECSDSSCSKEQKKHCESIGDTMRFACHQYNAAVTGLWNDCPLMKNSGQPPETFDCNR